MIYLNCFVIWDVSLLFWINYIKDKKLLIDNLKNVTRKNLDYVFSNISEHDLVVEIADDIINVASNLISYIKDSEGYELKLNYI